MIKLLDSSYKNIILEFLKTEKEKNIYLLTYLEFYGFNGPMLKIYGEFHDSSKPLAILFQLNKIFIIYSPGSFSVKKFADIINLNSYISLCGERSTLEKLKPFINFKTMERLTLSVIDNVNNLKIKINQIQNFHFGYGEKILSLCRQIEEFKENTDTAQQLDLNILTGIVKGSCILDNNNNIICMAQLLTDTPSYGIIINVGTHPNYRQKGYASSCVSHLIESHHTNEKLFGLTYSTNVAGKMYHLLGFKDVCSWCCIFN